MSEKNTRKLALLRESGLSAPITLKTLIESR